MGKTAQKLHASTQKFSEIVDIDEDVVLLLGGNACMIIEVTATNFSLLSVEEQNAKIYAYASLLNSLSFPIQILIRSKKLDISSYLKLLDNQANSSQNQMLATQIRLYRDFVQELVKVNTVLDKSFYIVLAYSPLEKGIGGTKTAVKRGNSTTPATSIETKAALHSKSDSLHSQLGRLNLPAKTLQKEELVKLFYEEFNGVAVETNQITDNVHTAVIGSAQKQP